MGNKGLKSNKVIINETKETNTEVIGKVTVIRNGKTETDNLYSFPKTGMYVDIPGKIVSIELFKLDHPLRIVFSNY